MTLLRADHLDFDPPLRELARRAFRRRIERVVVHATGVPIEGTDVKIDRLDVVATDIRLGARLRGPSVTVGGATFTAELTSEQLSELVPLPTGVSRLSVTGRGITFHLVTGMPFYTSVRLLTGNRLQVSPTAPATVPLLDLIGINIALPQLPGAAELEQLAGFGLTIDLPPLPANAVIDEVEPRDGALFVAGTLELSS